MCQTNLSKIKVVDLDRLIRKSNNRFLKNLPRFFKNRMKHILRQRQLNDLHNKCAEKYGIEYVNALLQELEIDINIHNQNDFNSSDKYIFVANHPLGGIDAIAFLHCIYKLKGNVVSPSNALLKNIANLHPLIVGVNVFGKNTRDQVDEVSRSFNSDVQIMMFPAGTVSRKINGKIQDFEWHKTFINKAIQTKRAVVPVYISGKNSSKFYRIAKFRKLLRIKMPIETLYLPQEMLKNKGAKIDFVVGKPINYRHFDNSKSKSEWAQFVREKVYKMGVNYWRMNQCRF